jgi:hypothetical protein
MGRMTLAVLLGFIVFVACMSLLVPLTTALRPEWLRPGTASFSATHVLALWIGLGENILAALIAGAVSARVGGASAGRAALGIAVLLLVVLVVVGISGVRENQWPAWRAVTQAILVPVAAYAGALAVTRRIRRL